MSKIIINEPATILKGALAGFTGTVREIYSLENQVEVEVDDFTSVITSSNNIDQSK